MAAKNPYEKTFATTVMTASKEELTLLLYEGALKFVNQAIMAVGNKDFGKSHQLIIKAENIITELRATLNLDYDIGESMDKLYIYIYDKLVQGNIKKDTAALEEARDLLREFRDAWKEAMIIARKENAAKQKKGGS